MTEQLYQDLGEEFDELHKKLRADLSSKNHENFINQFKIVCRKHNTTMEEFYLENQKRLSSQSSGQLLT